MALLSTMTLSQLAGNCCVSAGEGCGARERYFVVQVIRLHYKSTCCCKKLTDVCGKRIFVPVERGSPLLEPLLLFLDMLLKMWWNSDH